MRLVAVAIRPSESGTGLVLRDRSNGLGSIDTYLDLTAREVGRQGARPTILLWATYLTIASMYQDWAAYDDRAIGTELGDAFRRPRRDRTNANRQTATGFAAYHAMLSLYPDEAPRLKQAMRDAGLDPQTVTRDLRRPEGVGLVAAQAVIRARLFGGANQIGSEHGSDGTPYSDYTGLLTGQRGGQGS